MQDLSVDFAEWDDVARWWEDEGQRARARTAVDAAALAESRQAFGKIGSSTVGAAYVEALQARQELGERMGSYAESVAAHIRRDLDTYAAEDQEAARTLTT